MPFNFNKTEIEIFLQMEHFGNTLAQECLRRLKESLKVEDLEKEDYDRICYYIEAMHFSGKLTKEQKEECSFIANRI